MSDLKTVLMGIASTVNSDSLDLEFEDMSDEIMDRKYKNRPSPKMKKIKHKRHKKRGY